jgi:hypothetical protein
VHRFGGTRNPLAKTTGCGTIAWPGSSTARDTRPKELTLHSHLRLAIGGTLIAFAGIVAVGASAFLPAALERPLVPGGPPWTAERGGLVASDAPFESAREQPDVEVRQADSSKQATTEAEQPQKPEQPLTEPQETAQQPTQMRQSTIIPWPELLRRDVTLPEHAALMPPGGAPEHSAAEPSAETPSPAADQKGSAPPTAADSHSRPRKTVRRRQERVSGIKPNAATEPPAHAAASRPANRRAQPAKRSSGEALNAVRRFGDHLRDIPVSSYSGDGARRDIVIHPRSIQDVYYYSSPR